MTKRSKRGRYTQRMRHESVISQAAAMSGIDDADVDRLLSIVVQIIETAVRDGCCVELAGLGVFEDTEWKEKPYRTPGGAVGVMPKFRKIKLRGVRL